MSGLNDEDVAKIVRSRFEWWPRAAEPEHVLLSASMLVRDLIRFFAVKAERGDDEAASALGSIALTATTSFQDGFLKDPARYRGAFEAQRTVPVLLGKRKRDREKAETVVSLSNVGDLVPTNTSGKQILSPISRVAEALYDYVASSKFGIIAMPPQEGIHSSRENARSLRRREPFFRRSQGITP